VGDGRASLILPQTVLDSPQSWGEDRVDAVRTLLTMGPHIVKVGSALAEGQWCFGTGKLSFLPGQHNDYSP
jgi:hypothetical protein